MRNFLIIGFLFIMYGCTGYHYVPSPHYVPLNTEKGELSVCTGPNHIELGYSFANHFSCFASGKLRSTVGGLSLQGMFNKENSGVERKGDASNEINIGLSYFNKFKFLRFEVLGGTGVGSLDYEHTIDLVTDYEFKLNTSRQNLFIQPNVGVKIGNYLEAGISAKFLRCRYYDIKTEFIPGSNSADVSPDTYFIGKKNIDVYFFETGLTFRAGFKNFKAQVQIIPEIDSSNTQIKCPELGFFIGFNMNLNVLKIKENSKPKVTALSQF